MQLRISVSETFEVMSYVLLIALLHITKWLWGLECQLIWYLFNYSIEYVDDTKCVFPKR